MKKILPFLALCLLMGCSGVATQNLTWGTDTLTRHINGDTVSMTFPIALSPSPAADSANQAIALALLENFYVLPTHQHLPIGQVVDSLLAKHSADTALQDSEPYLLLSEGTVYERGGIASVMLQQQIYLGGAHGLEPVRLLNFDRRTGRLLPLSELCVDTVKLSQLNREAFVHFMQAKGGEDYTPYLFVTVDKLPLPQNIGLDNEGMVMLYNPYEIAAFAFGQSRYIIPYGQIDPLLSAIAKP